MPWKWPVNLVSRTINPKVEKLNVKEHYNKSLPSKTKIVDVFRFFNEFRILQLRLEVLWDIVDYFVITESPLTHSGKPKQMNFYENRYNFRKYQSKIIYNPLPSIPEDFSHLVCKRSYRLNFGDIDPNSKKRYIQNPISYQREAYERDIQILGLEKLEHSLDRDSVILVSDLDEIPNPEILVNTSWIDHTKTYVCEQKAYLYKLNLLYYDEWLGTNIFRMSHLQDSKKGLHQIHADAKKGTRVAAAGWHFSWMGDDKHFREKLAAQPESEHFDTEERRQMSREIISNRLDPFGRPLQLKKVPLDNTFPFYLSANINQFEDLIEK